MEASVFPVISTEEAAATEWRNLLGKMRRSQIPPLASLGRDDKRGGAARSVDKRERAAEGVGPYGWDDKRRVPLALNQAPEEEGRNGVLWAEL